MPERQCGQSLPAHALINPVAHLRRTWRRTNVFQIGSPHYVPTAIFDNERMPGTDSKIGQIARNVLGDTRQWQIGRRLEASAGLEFFALVPL